MSPETADAPHLTSPPSASRTEASPPSVQRVPASRSHHGDTFVDEYAWLADKANPATIAYLEAQNSYTEALTAGQEPVRETIFGEIKARTKETDLSAPYRKGRWWYYSRTVAGQQYAVQCRRAVQPGESGPPATGDGGPLPGEQILLDGNELAGDSQFFALGTSDVSPDGTQLAYSTDYEGGERFTVRVKSLVTGEVAADEIPGAFYGSAWSADGAALFYVTVDESWRPNRVWRHLIGQPAATDVVVFEETDERFWVGIELTRSERYLLIYSSSKLTSEVWLLDAADPTGDFTVVAPRRHGIEYSVDHQLATDETGDRLLILHNDHAENFELAQAPVTDPSAWTPVISHRADTRLLGVDAFAAHFVVYLRRDGLTGLRVVRAGGEYEIDLAEPVYRVTPGTNPEYASATFRLGFVSLVTPDSVYDCDVATGELTLLRRRPVLALPGAPEYDPADYEQQRDWATAEDGTAIPISIVRRRGTPRDGTAPAVLYGYGSYEISTDPTFSIPRLSLLDRGFVYAIAHVRGGGEMGRRWYDDGKMLNKINTFTDFVACARHLVTAGWSDSKRIIARGGSAGGLLMGASVNIAPEAFGGIVAQVPFVDALTSILDPSLPLTVTEWEEWGDPLHDAEVYRYMKSYSPYENIDDAAVYPPILAITSLNDTRVLYSEPAKWIAALQARARGGPFLLKTEMIAGHGGRSGRYDAWREEAMVLAWTVQTAAARG
jgi:oligopeptidase B